MRYLVTIVHEVWHLFVDDAAFAAAIVVWPALIWLAVRLGVPLFLAPEMLSIGYGIILYLGAIDRAYRDNPKT
jgi:small basic protein